jgi:hypothetical protein
VDGGWYLENHYSGPPPPLVKVRMVRGGPEFLWAVDLKFNVNGWDVRCMKCAWVEGGVDLG